MLDRVTGGDLALTGAARATRGGGFGFTDLLASGRAWLGPAQRRFRARQGRPERPHRRAAGQRSRSPRLGQGSRSPPTLTGRPTISTPTLKATLSEGRLLDRKTSGLTLEAQATHITGQLEAKASASRRHRRPPAARLGPCREDRRRRLARRQSRAQPRLGAPRGRRRPSAPISLANGDAQLQRGQSRRPLAARAHQDERRAPGEGRAPRLPAAGRRSRSPPAATG